MLGKDILAEQELDDPADSVSAEDDGNLEEQSRAELRSKDKEIDRAHQGVGGPAENVGRRDREVRG